MLSGFVNVLKPAGPTASDMVVRLRKILNEKKIGHLGTLDPGAVGVLPIAVGNATKLFNLLTEKTKVYRAFFTFGTATDTLDSYGKVIKTDAHIPDEKTVAEAAEKFIGKIEQVPPQYSAVSVGGVRAYKLARSGVSVELKSRSVTISKFQLLRNLCGGKTFAFDIECSGGTYIRSLARDLAERCGTVAYMSGLIRLASGCFTIDNALTIEEIETIKSAAVLPVTYPLSYMEDYYVRDEFYSKLRNGVRISCNFDGERKIYCKDEFFGVGISENRKLRLEYYLKND